MGYKIKRFAKFTVYILKCKKGTYYTGYTSNLKKRIKLHNAGQGAKYLRGKAPVKLVYSKKYKYYKCALNAEREIKTYSRQKKENFLKTNGRYK